MGNQGDSDRATAAVEAYAGLQPVVAEMRAKGMTVKAMATELNGRKADPRGAVTRNRGSVLERT